MRSQHLAFAVVALVALTSISGCSRFHHHHHEYVYVWARQMFLRDRVAAVSNRVVEVKNGQRLDVLEHDRRFLRVQTDQGQSGWIPERAVIDHETFNNFQRLATEHKDSPVVANATLRDDFYLHLSPGRDTDRFYLLSGNSKIQMLLRASVPKVTVPQRTPPPQAPSPSRKGKAESIAKPEPVVMEDWWLVRDAQGRTGWLESNRMDVNVPDEIAQYAEGARIVGAYVLAGVHDDQSQSPNHQVREYVCALAPLKSGLPFDFDQVRVFTWNVRHHRYETAFRLHNIYGYLPLKVSSQPASNGAKEPVFDFQIATSADVAIDPQTGIARPVSPRTLRFALRDTVVRRIGPDMAPIPPIRSGEDKPRQAAKARHR